MSHTLLQRDNRKMEKKYSWLIGGLAVLAIFLTFIMTSSVYNSPRQIDSKGLLDENGYTTIQVVRADGTREPAYTSHNLLYDAGANSTRAILTGGTANNIFKNISLCNATIGSVAECASPIKTGGEAFTAYASCGLANNESTVSLLPQHGNWTLTETFTATCDNLAVNATRLTNASGSMFAGNTFTLTNLMTNDKITVNWTVAIS